VDEPSLGDGDGSGSGSERVRAATPASIAEMMAGLLVTWTVCAPESTARADVGTFTPIAASPDASALDTLAAGRSSRVRLT
jgi:predicted RNA-binding Zn ribbon-like protein